jgi:hypothetical protein
VLDIRKHQFLVLLLVIETEQDQCSDFGLLAALLEKARHGLIDVLAIGQNVGNSRS